jgi:bifunctional non-homologous end joining protein LigD
LKPLETGTSPFSGKGAPKGGSGVHWIRPELVAEIDFAGWTADGHIRQASFKGLREDKPAADVVHEAERDIAASVAPDAAETAVADAGSEAAADEAATAAPARPQPKASPAVKPGGAIEVRGVTITKADKPLWPPAGASPAFTKGDLAAYLDQVGERMLAHHRGRPRLDHRTPDGIAGERFFQRHAMPGQSPLVTLMDVMSASRT